jgi:hypothetical protein
MLNILELERPLYGTINIFCLRYENHLSFLLNFSVFHFGCLDFARNFQMILCMKKS